MLPLSLLDFQLLATVQEGLNTLWTVHDVLTAPLTVIGEGGFTHALQTTIALLFFFIFTHWKQELVNKSWL